MSRASLLLALLIATLSGLLRPAAAQGDPAPCAERYERGVIAMMEHCFVAPAGTVCAASGETAIALKSGERITAAGTPVQLASLAALTLAEGAEAAWPLARLVLPDPVMAGRSATLIVLGPAALTFEALPGSAPGSVFSLQAPAAPACEGLPYPGVLVQSAENSLTLLQVNGTQIAVNGMAVISVDAEGALVISALTRETILAQSGAVIFAGSALTASGATAGDAAPYTLERVAHLPVEVLPQMQPIALPGSATPLTDTVLHTQPAAERYTFTKVPAGLPIGVFGRTSAGDWVYVRAYSGETGWVPAYTLALNVPVPLPIFDETPPPINRPFGAIQAYITTDAESANLRSGPGRSAAIIATVPFRTELALYARDTSGTWLLVETRDGVRGWISADLVSRSSPYRLEELPFAPEP